MDTNENIIKWGSEEIFIPYVSPMDNRVHRYFPDFIAKIKSKDGKERVTVIEVKPYKQTQEPERGKKRKATYLKECTTYSVNIAKWKAAREYCRKKGWDFTILTEKELF